MQRKMNGLIMKDRVMDAILEYDGIYKVYIRNIYLQMNEWIDRDRIHSIEMVIHQMIMMIVHDIMIVNFMMIDHFQTVVFHYVIYIEMEYVIKIVFMIDMHILVLIIHPVKDHEDNLHDHDL